MRHTAFLPLLLAVSLSACSFIAPVAPSSGSGATMQQDLLSTTAFMSKDPTFTITPPRNWKVDSSGHMGTIVVFQNPTADVESASAFSANIYVIQEDMSGMNVQNYIEANRTSMQTFNEGFISTDDRELTVDGNPAYILEGTYTQDAFQLRSRQLIIMKDGFAYIVGATTLASKWDKYKEVFNTSLGSVQL